MKDTYLLFYNLAQFCGWSVVFFTQRLDLLLFFQTLQLLEVLHCLVGFVKSSALQTFTQILSRLLVVWVALYPFPETRETLGYDMILWAWPIAETTRYIYYAFNLMKLNLYIITWARYTFFIILYPLGASGELLILYKLMQLVRQSEKFNFSLPNPLNISIYGDILILVLMLTYAPCKYSSSGPKIKSDS